jgi:tRNA A58 N-methylase Trm61
MKFYGIDMQHNPNGLLAMETLLNMRRPGTIYELGTGKGAMTCFLGTWALGNEAHVLSYDIEDALEPVARRILSHLPVECILGDLYQDPTKGRLLNELAQPGRGPRFIYCDGGDKNLELEIFSPALSAGDVIGCHDCGTEVHIDTAIDVMKKRGFVLLANIKTGNQLFWTKL